MAKKVAVVGSRDYPDLELVRKFVRGLAEHDRDITVVSGNARGVDRVAEKEARKIGLSVVSLPADWDAHGPVAGFLRNGRIIEQCDALAAFWDGSSNGTEDTVNKAVAAGKRISVWGPVGEKIRGLKGMALHRLDSQLVKGCQKCELCRMRKSTVFGQGNPDARLVFIGEGPGHDEDESGLAFVGRAGKKLTALIEGMGLSRDDVFICNIVCCRPPGNRNPAPDEVAACAPRLYKQIRAIAPEVVVALGACAAKLLLRTDEGIGKLRGRFHEFLPRSNPIPLMPTYHPAYLLRNPADTKKVADDLKLVADRLGIG